MDNILKKSYEISLWEDIPTFHIWTIKSASVNEDDYKQGNYYYKDESNRYIIDYSSSFTENRSYYTLNTLEGEYEYFLPELNFDEPVIVKSFYKERKLCIIGSDTMTSPIRAVNAKLVSNINGTSTLTFSLYSKYWDEEQEVFLDNPFLQYMTNERKIKVRYGDTNSPECKWYDLIVKNIQENSDTKTFNYTAKDQFINELSKSGFDIELDAELENNMGTIKELAEVVLDGSDWQLDKNNVDLLRQYREEPLYEIILKDSISAKDMLTQSSISIASGERIYVFYSIISNKESSFQFIYCNKESDYEVDDNRVLLNVPNYSLTTPAIAEYNNGIPTFASSMVLSEKYRGKRLVRQEVIKFDSTINKYVNVYEDSEHKTVYGFTEAEYISPIAVNNLITNPNAFTSTSGWTVGKIWNDTDTKPMVYPEYNVVGVPDIQDMNGEEEQSSFLRYAPTQKYQCLFNSGIDNKRNNLKGFASGEKYVIRIKFGTPNEEIENRIKTVDFNKNFVIDCRIGTYTLDSGVYTIQKLLFKGSLEQNKYASLDPKQEVGYGSVIVSCENSISSTELANSRVGIFLRFQSWNEVYLIEDVQFFPYETCPVEDGTEKIILPGSLKTNSLVKTKYYYYQPNTYNSIDNINFLYTGYEPSSNYVKVYNENKYEKIRSITASKSNRFNLIQELAEIFECWPRFTVQRNMETGQILLGKDIYTTSCPEGERYRQQKWVSFYESVIQENYSGFKYGINLKSIQRTLDSDGIVSKIIVKDNANEFGKNGFCSIARAKENYSGENFIFDFNYYIQQGLLSANIVNNDLYIDSNGYLGYYKKLKQLNSNRESSIERIAFLSTEIMEYESSYSHSNNTVESAQEQKVSLEIQVENKTGFTYQYLLEVGQGKITDDPTAAAWWEDGEVKGQIESIVKLNNTIRTHEVLRDTAERNLEISKEERQQLEDSLKEIASQKRILNLEFYKKYSRYIQEGSWTSEDYIDDNLYYLDAESTLHTSSQPKVTYTINVLELSQIEEYSNYQFSLGDKTFIEDTEFFGWVWDVDGFKTPYKEEIVVTETTISFDSPEQNIIKVQNYKTQFEDLFQRITATTQALQFSTGDYNKASSIVNPEGTISIDVLQNSINNNALKLENAKDQSVVWDESGITTTSLSSPNEMLRIISGGIFVSNDGGVTWTTGITANGINAALLTAGQINTSVVNITNGTLTSFRWDSRGLTAYSFQQDENGNNRHYDPNKFVRFDHYGIYGIDHSEDASNGPFNPDEELDGISGEQKIWNEANYALTWQGFMLKSNNNGGYVSITSDNDFQVFGDNKEMIKIGCLNSETGKNYVYGIRIKDTQGATVLETGSDGKVWVRDILYVGGTDTTAEAAVKIGYLDKENINEEEAVHKVIQAGSGESSFTVFENGLVRASNGEFTGTINATGGRIKEKLYIGPEDADNIILDGINTRIESNSFKIEPDVATFNNINCAGTIRTSVFEKDSIQALGGMMFFKPAFKIENFEVLTENEEAKSSECILSTLDKPLKGFEQSNSSNIYWIELYSSSAFFLTNASTGQKFKLEANQPFVVGIEEKVITKGTYKVIPIKFNTIEQLKQATDNGTVKSKNLISIDKQQTEEEGEKDWLRNYDDYYISWSSKLPYTRVVKCNVKINEKDTGIYLPELATKETQEGSNVVRVPRYFESSGLQSKNVLEVPDDEYLVLVKSDNTFESNYSQILWYNYNVNSPLVMIKGNLIDKDKTKEDYPILIHLGGTSDAVIGINSTDGQWRDFLYPRGLTIKTFDPENGINTKPEVFLGDLNSLSIDGVSGYGLYSENVYLTGSLTTSTSTLNSETTYAGVNTKSGVKAEVFKGLSFNDVSNIVFWAGASRTEDNSIQKAPFQVTEQGSVYAKQALIENSIFSNGSIYSADIYTARIHGYDGNKLANLTFYDANQGISFKSGYQQNELESFCIGTNGLGFRDENSLEDENGLKIRYFINITSSEKEKDIKFITTGDSYLEIAQNKIQSINNQDSNREGVYLEINNENFNFTCPLNNEVATYADGTVPSDSTYSLSRADKGWNLYVWGG